MDIPKTEHPFEIVKRICTQKKVEPLAVFSSLVYGLSESQTVVGTTFGLNGGTAENQANVTDEIRSITGMANKDFWPKSVIDLLARFSPPNPLGNHGRAYSLSRSSFKINHWLHTNSRGTCIAIGQSSVGSQAFFSPSFGVNA